MFENFTFETFAPHVGTEFHVRLPQGNLPLTLVSAQPGIQAMLTGQRRLGFSLIFRGPPQIYLPANSYDIAHPRLGLLKMMLHSFTWCPRKMLVLREDWPRSKGLQCIQGPSREERRSGPEGLRRCL